MKKHLLEIARLDSASTREKEPALVAHDLAVLIYEYLYRSYDFHKIVNLHIYEGVGHEKYLVYIGDCDARTNPRTKKMHYDSRLDFWFTIKPQGHSVESVNCEIDGHELTHGKRKFKLRPNSHGQHVLYEIDPPAMVVE